MTTEEYKQLVPEHAHLQGDKLWNAMEEYVLAHQDKTEPLLTAEEEEEYQKAVIADREFWAKQGMKSINYNRWLWYNFDRVEKRDPDAPPLSSYQYIVFDVSQDKNEEDGKTGDIG